MVGKSVLGEGNEKVIEALDEAGALIRAEDYGHKYPYDWRTKKPTIFRATDQWFASVEGFREDALAAVDSVSLCLVHPQRTSPNCTLEGTTCVGPIEITNFGTGSY